MATHCTSVAAALVPSPVAFDFDERMTSPVNGVSALEPQLDRPVGSHIRRTVTPIGPSASSSPRKIIHSTVHSAYSPLSCSQSTTNDSLKSVPSWDSYSVQENTYKRYANPNLYHLNNGHQVVKLEADPQAVAEAAADDVLNDSFESLNLGPPMFATSFVGRGVSTASPFSNSHHTQAQTPPSPYEISTSFSAPLHSPPQQHRDILHRSRSILLRNLPPGVDDESLRGLLGRYGELRELGAQHRVRGGRGSVIATFYDLRHACRAVESLDGIYRFGRRLEVRFYTRALVHEGSPTSSPMKDSATPINNGTLVVFNLDPSTTAEEIRSIFGAIGDVKEIRATPNKRHHKFVEFFDIRDALRALNLLNKTEVAGKKIKIEISRPGGRGSSVRTEEKRTPLPDQQSLRTPPSAPRPAHYAAASRDYPCHDPTNPRFSPLESSKASPFSRSVVSNSGLDHVHFAHETLDNGSMVLPAVGPTPCPTLSPRVHCSLTGSRTTHGPNFDQRLDVFQLEPSNVGTPCDGLSKFTQFDSWGSYPSLFGSPEDGRGVIANNRQHSYGDCGHFAANMSAYSQSIGRNEEVRSSQSYSPATSQSFVHDSYSPPSSTTQSIPSSFASQSDNSQSSLVAPQHARNTAHSPRKQLYSTVLRMPAQESAPKRQTVPSTTRPQASNTSTNSSNGHSKNLLDLKRVLSGDDRRTSLMIRNIPNKYNQRMLLATLEEHHRRCFDFVYLPIDFKNKCNVGYAFINLTRTEHIANFYAEFHGKKWGRFNSEKVCEICYARIQGKAALVAHFQNSSLMNEDPLCRPVVFDAKGQQQEFPVGSNVRRNRGPSARDNFRTTDSPPYSPGKQRGRAH